MPTEVAEKVAEKKPVEYEKSTGYSSLVTQSYVAGAGGIQLIKPLDKKPDETFVAEQSRILGYFTLETTAGALRKQKLGEDIPVYLDDNHRFIKHILEYNQTEPFMPVQRAVRDNKAPESKTVRAFSTLEPKEKEENIRQWQTLFGNDEQKKAAHGNGYDEAMVKLNGAYLSSFGVSYASAGETKGIVDIYNELVAKNPKLDTESLFRMAARVSSEKYEAKIDESKKYIETLKRVDLSTMQDDLILKMHWDKVNDNSEKKDKTGAYALGIGEDTLGVSEEGIERSKSRYPKPPKQTPVEVTTTAIVPVNKYPTIGALLGSLNPASEKPSATAYRLNKKQLDGRQGENLGLGRKPQTKKDIEKKYRELLTGTNYKRGLEDLIRDVRVDGVFKNRGIKNQDEHKRLVEIAFLYQKELYVFQGKSHMDLIRLLTDYSRSFLMVNHDQMAIRCAEEAGNEEFADRIRRGEKAIVSPGKMGLRNNS